MATIETSKSSGLVTAETFLLLPGGRAPTELIRGRIVEMNMPGPRHGWICGRIVFLLSRFLEDHPLGRVVGNDSAVITQRGPDSVRGADAAYYSFQRVPRGPLPDTYLSVAPEIVIEVRSPIDRWKDLLAKVAEYLQAGVERVCVVDTPNESVIVYFPDQNHSQQTLTVDDVLELPDLLPGFSLAVGDLFPHGHD